MDLPTPTHLRLASLPALALGVGLALAGVPAQAAPPASAPEPAPMPDPGGEAQGDELDPAQERAREAYARGTQLYNEAKFSEALAAFQEAATLFASPDFQFNIAKCYERLGDFEEAVRHYEIYLRTTDDPSDRAVIEASIADLKRRIADGELEPPPEVAPEPSKPPGRALIITGGALLGVGVGVGVAGGLAFGLMVSRDNTTLGGVLDGNPDKLTFAEAKTLADRARGNQTLEVVMVSVGGAVAITGVALLAVGLKQKKSGSAPQTTAASLRVAPTWSSTSAGLVLGGSF